jgi:signal peptidase I
MFMQIISTLCWLTLPIGLVCLIDDWLVRPRRQIAALPQVAPDPGLLALCYYVLPFLVAATVLRLLVAERLDFALVLSIITIVTGIVWWLDAAWLRGRREAATRAAGQDPAKLPEPATVDYARSFFPVALVVLVLRSFIFEPFRIPSDSMMPTLLDGDFIIVNKYAYGLRWPVLNHKFLDIGAPQRGDVVVFRYPLDPGVNYIKRLVGLPGDHVQVTHDRITINGKPVPFQVVAPYDDGCYLNMQLAVEQLGSHTHQAMLCPVPLNMTAEPPPGCNRRNSRGYFCGSSGPGADAALLEPDSAARTMVVPPNEYLMMGDNRDNSEDGRVWGYVPEDHLVGKATRVWFNWDWGRSGGPLWSRIGQHIE